MTINENLTPSVKASLLASTSQAALLVHEVMDKIAMLNIPDTSSLSDAQLNAIAANGNTAPIAKAA